MGKLKIKYVIIAVVALIIIFVSFLVYKNLFSGSRSTRMDGVEDHKLTTKEIDSAKEKLNEISDIDSVKIYTSTNSKMVKIYITLKDDSDFKSLKNKCDESLESFSEENLSFYDFQVFVESEKEDSEVYPQIGYRHKTDKEFSW